MASTLPVINPCCTQTCSGETLVQVPGPAGEDGGIGLTGNTGATGKSAYTTLTLPFTMPGEGLNGQASVLNTGWMVVGEIVVVQGLGSLRVISVDTPLLATLQNLENTASQLYPTNAVAGSIVAATSRVSPGGAQGPSGVALSDQVQEVDGDAPPADPTRPYLRFPSGGGLLRQWSVVLQAWI